jgi:dihydroorotate dehydrogenase (NAD+) catalytic subunit
VGTASDADPRAVENSATGLKRWCAEHDVAEVKTLTGGLLV